MTALGRFVKSARCDRFVYHLLYIMLSPHLTNLQWISDVQSITHHLC